MTLDSHSYNYGGTLQEYALLRTLENEGFEAEIIDFDVSSEIYTFSCKRSLLNLDPAKIAAKAKQKLEKIPRIDISHQVFIRHKRFDEFRNDYLKLSKRYTAKSIGETAAEYDILVCGSDQIWNPDFNVPEFFLNFGVKSQKKIIYGASLGRDHLSRRQLKVYKTLMSGLDAISVREDNAKTILQTISDKEIEVVLDPTLLIERDKWLELAIDSLIMDKEYMFCYFLDNNYEKQKAAEKVALEMGLVIVAIPFLHDIFEEESESFGDYQLSDIGPQEFLGLISRAKLVLTDSFHATVFSILFRKDFWVFGRDCGTYNMNSRIVTLLRYFDLFGRLIEVDEVKSYKKCAYQKQYEKFERKKELSLEFLRKALK